jgi:small subunit ribosomal protein S1
MPDEKKPASSGPVVIRKVHLRPPSPGAKIEPPVEERIEPPPRSAPDQRPLWQRLAESKVAGAGPAPATGPGPKRSRHPDRGRPSRRGEERRPRDHEKAAAAATSSQPAPAAAEPPPALEVAAPEEGTFADMFAQTDTHRRRFEVGEKVAGKILQIGHDVAFLELGSGIAEGMIEIAELQDAEGTVTARIGDIVDGVVVRAGERGVMVSKGLGRTHQPGREALVEAARTGLPVEGLVKAANKGGLEVEVMGQRAFCPMSQIDVRFVGDPASFVGQKLRFRVQRADARDAVLSRRALLEEERAEAARQTRQRLAPEAIFEGTVTSVQDYGAFVDIGGIEGLVHVSELSWDRVSKPGDLLKPGDLVKVQVLEVKEDPKKGERISLSVKSLEPRPEPKASEAAAGPAVARPQPPPPPKVGDVVEATVDKIEPFGIFVRFAGGRGLVPASETGTPRGADLRKAFKPGDSFTALVSAIDERGRLRLSKTEAEAAEERKEAQEYMARAAPKGGGKGFGTLGDLLREKLRKE